MIVLLQRVLGMGSRPDLMVGYLALLRLKRPTFSHGCGVMQVYPWLLGLSKVFNTLVLVRLHVLNLRQS